ncbi:aminotransferase class IV [Ruicaihuangia caeni]|uniref:Aminotransferase class IV n=1 Tax=Ruicaihuangia caeni TaxID=3042517 RepID=A0AAW6T5F9_9MICO|nr:aminotransferase class IV [Klugiella sp. YN-L-19]MDI2097916.1 aminotransferase class IV [Klugiella sp. YN-L-19]
MSAPEHDLFEWTGDGFRSAPHRELPLLAADSWLVTEGAALAVELHRERFSTAVANVVDAVEPGHPPHGSEEPALDVDAFFDALLESIPEQEQWFPRVELVARSIGPGADAVEDAAATPVSVSVADLRLRWRLRPAPELRRSVVLSTWSGADPRMAPTVKGPDIGRLAAANAAVRASGADEAMFTDASTGAVIDGATSAVMWWRGDAMVFPDQRLPRVASVTARVLRTVAAARGAEVREELASPEELDGLEIWTLNALHGLRIVTEWQDGPRSAEQPGRLEAWRAALGSLRRPLRRPPQ